ncbi:MAG: hypothetical protein P8I43_04315 [Bacteroidia bacterium]|nr:hypothetical protein [Bacteroidia bacterium]MDG2042771.1 hypothetical protein [Bacteroidia bacterium]|tara:strand:- start:38168 stop:38833 length:666 start_codon:yes stop_codon:yes gene_type:complete
MSEKLVEIIDGLNNKAALKQHIYRNTLTVFEQFKKCATEITDKLTPEVVSKDESLEVELTEIGEFEFHLKFSGDTIAFIMHTNVFSFPPEHEISKTSYVNEVQDRGYCGMIQAYNFLSDSLKYQRLADIGYLLARIFINCEGNFYVDGQRQLDFLFKDFSKQKINNESVIKVIEQTMLYALDFDLYIPPMDNMKEITVQEKDYFNNPRGFATGKRLGFKKN